MDLEEIPYCEAWTKASLQRFTRGPEIMMTLSRFLQERVEMESKMKKARQEFLSKWDKKLRNGIGSNMPKDDLKEVMKVVLAAEERKAAFHSLAIDQLQDPSGPMAVLNNYIYGSGCMMDIINIKNLYNDAMNDQKQLEKDVKFTEKHYLHVMKKEDRLMKHIDAVEEKEEDHHKVMHLKDDLKQLESNVARAKVVYSNNLEKERRNRSTFNADMKEFHTESDRYETTRLENVKTVLQKLLDGEREAEKQRISMERLYKDGLKCLENYDIQTEITEFDQLFSYQHQFPTQKEYKGDNVKTKTIVKNDRGNVGKVDKKTDMISDEVQVLKSQEETEVLFIKTAKPIEKLKVNNYSHHGPLPPPNPADESFMSSFDLPNAVANTNVHRAPRRNTTTIDMGSASDSSSDDDVTPRIRYVHREGQMKVKVYGIKPFNARTADEISFKRGHKVYMTRAENAEGLAYGYVKKGKLLKKKVYGFFPAKLVSTDAKKKSAFKPQFSFKKSKSQETAESNNLIYDSIQGC